MAYQLREIFICLCLATLGTSALAAQGNFEDAELVNEFITMSFSSSHPYDLRHTIPGEPDIDYPIYSSVPKTSFDCIGRHEGYYADMEARCQVFRICANTDLVGRGFAFLCPNGTLFSQKNFVCDWYRNVDCSESERYYSKNDGNRIGSKAEIMETVRQMMEHPMKTISLALNRGKPIASQPDTPSSSVSSPTRNTANQQFNSRRQPVTLRQIETAAGLSDRNSQNRPDFTFSGSKSTQPTFTTSSSASNRNRNTAATQGTFPATNSNPFPSQDSPLDAVSSSDSSTPSYSTESSSDGSEVYVSSLGELSTDPEANFNPQTARIIAEPTSSLIDVRFSAESGNINTMNFAEKVNAGLNGQEIVNKNEIIAPEYVKNIIQQNVPVPRSTIQPPTFSFASNINSLLDEVAYEAELEGQTSQQVQSRTPTALYDDNKKKPFRFLSRGFSYENRKTDGSYTYTPPSAPRSLPLRYQPSTSTQSLTTPAPVATTEAIHISNTQSTTEQSKTYSPSKLESTSNLNGRATNALIQGEGQSKPLAGTKPAPVDVSAQNEDVIALRFGSDVEAEENTSTKREQKDIVSLFNNIPQELSDEDKAVANKQAETLLLAGVKQTLFDNGDLSKNDLEETAPIVPLYVRVPEQQVVTTTTTSTTTPAPQTTSAFRIRSTTTTTTTPRTTTSSTEGSRRYTVSSVRRRQTTHPTVPAKRRNPVRTRQRTTTSTTSATPTTPTSTTARPSGRSISRGTALPPATTPTTTTTRPSSSSRRRTVSRFSFGSSPRRGASTSSTTSTTTTTTTASPDKKIAVRSSDKETSDLTAVASTYNAAPKREYNSIRQNTFRQAPRRRPTSKTTFGEITTPRTTLGTTRPSTTTTTVQPPRSSPSSLPIATLAPFSYEELSPLSTTSTTPEPLPASYLSFQDLTKAIFDDSLLQNFRKNQDTLAASTIRAPTVRTYPQVQVRQQVPVSATKPVRTQQGLQPKTTTPAVITTPHVPLKQFIVNKFGANQATTSTTPASRVITLTNTHKQQTSQFPAQQYIVQQSNAVKSVPAVQRLVPIQSVQQPLQRTVIQQQPLQRTVAQQPPQFSIQRLQQIPLQQQFFQVRQQQPVLQQQQQALPQQQVLLQQQPLPQQRVFPQQQAPPKQLVPPQQQFVPFQQKLSPPPQQSVFRPVQSVQLIQPIQQTSFGFTNQQQRLPSQQQPQRAVIQRGQEILQRTIPSIQQQAPQVQQFHSIQHNQQQRSQQQQFPAPQSQSQIQIFPSQMTIAQTIPGQAANVQSEVGSINVRLPTNLAGLIPSTNLLETKYSGDAISQAQKRIDLAGDANDFAAGDNKSVYSGLSSYDVPLNSVGRLANDITDLLRRLRRL